jgi:hypothetical protein
MVNDDDYSAEFEGTLILETKVIQRMSPIHESKGQLFPISRQME